MGNHWVSLPIKDYQTLINGLDHILDTCMGILSLYPKEGERIAMVPQNRIDSVVLEANYLRNSILK